MSMKAYCIKYGVDENTVFEMVLLEGGRYIAVSCALYHLCGGNSGKGALLYQRQAGNCERILLF